MIDFFTFQYFDLLFVGLTTAAIAILGYIVFISDSRSATNRTFFLLALIDILYASVNYFSYQTTSPILVLWLLRFVLFFAVLYSLILFHLFYVFPQSKSAPSSIYKFVVIPVSLATAGLTLSPYVFTRISGQIIAGQVTNPERGPAMPIFGVVIVFLVVWGLILLAKKARLASGVQKIQFRFVLAGSVITYSLLIVFNFVLPVIFNNLEFIRFAPVYTLPFIIFTTYAIMRYRLLNIKIIATEILIFFLSIATLFEIIFSENLGEIVLRILIFVSVLFAGILLIQSVIKEVQQRERLQFLDAQLEKANEQLQVLDKARAEFITMASHQLRTPPASIKWYLAAILAGDFGPISQEARVALEKTKITNNELILLIDDMLNVSRVERGKLEFAFQETDLLAVTQTILDELLPQAISKGLKLVFRPPRTSIPKIMADKQKLGQVVNNLVDNAIKYTSQGQVKVSVSYAEGNIVIKVEDTGRGIRPEETEKIFDKFARSKDSKHYPAGLGLGLYLANIVVSQHKGRIAVESKGLDKGSTFSVILPIKNGLQATPIIFDLTKVAKI